MRPQEADPMSSPELVVLLDESGTPIGTCAKEDVHGPDTPRHLAFSCYLANENGELLLTRRALSKQTWPGVWTNSFCGHPGPGEAPIDALRRRARQELGAVVSEITCELPDFSYRAVDASGIVENEICPVFSARLTGALAPDPQEVCEWSWISPEDLIAAVAAAPFAFSPWMRKQLPELQRLSSLMGERNDG